MKAVIEQLRYTTNRDRYTTSKQQQQMTTSNNYKLIIYGNFIKGF